MTTPENPEIPGLKEALTRAREAAQGWEPDDEPASWQPVWKRPRRRLQDAGRRRLAAGESRRPRPRQNRIGNAAARRDARALSRVRHSNAWLW
ncbi:hypothetical protein [Streptomyces scopuliridis]|uniref:hypothetical protein n=1 Tax=Streptomyces scopuliridis TaxID=452529 RepID=UPI0036AD4EBC